MLERENFEKVERILVAMAIEEPPAIENVKRYNQIQEIIRDVKTIIYRKVRSYVRGDIAELPKREIELIRHYMKQNDDPTPA